MRGLFKATALAVLTVAEADARGPAPELAIDAGATLSTTVDGAPARLRVDPGAVAMPAVTTELASRAGLKAGPFEVEWIVGPVSVAGRTALGRIDLGRGPELRRIAWFDRHWDPIADVVVGPGGVPARVVRFRLRPARPGERVGVLPMTGQGGLEDRWAGLFGLISVEGSPVRVRFDLRAPTTATASVGMMLSRAHDGTVEGGASLSEVSFGVRRPVRTLRLARPLVVGPLSVGRLLVRVADHGDASTIGERRGPRDPDEVVVTGRRKRDRSRDHIVLGRDQLDRCSSITFDKPARQVRLSCL